MRAQAMPGRAPWPETHQRPSTTEQGIAAGRARPLSVVDPQQQPLVAVAPQVEHVADAIVVGALEAPARQPEPVGEVGVFIHDSRRLVGDPVLLVGMRQTHGMPGRKPQRDGSAQTWCAKMT